MKLNVNIDHIATLRQARRGLEPDLIYGGQEALKAGAHGITFHLREDRRHIQDQDVLLIKEQLKAPLNFEAGFAPDIIDLILKTQPQEVTLVPETLKEVTTEGGLDVLKSKEKLLELIPLFKEKGIIVSLFVDPTPTQLEAAAQLKVDAIELHTGLYAATKGLEQEEELNKIIKMVSLGNKLGLTVNAGHGLNYENIKEIAKIEGIYELNIGHSIVSKAIFVGMFEAVSEMLRLIKKG